MPHAPRAVALGLLGLVATGPGLAASPHGQLPQSADAFLRIDKPFRNEDLQVVLDAAASRARAA